MGELKTRHVIAIITIGVVTNLIAYWIINRARTSGRVLAFAKKKTGDCGCNGA